MSIAVITGSAGLIGSEAATFYADLGLDIIGIDNDMRAQLFGADASVEWQKNNLERTLRNKYKHNNIDIRDDAAIEKLFSRCGTDIALVVHAAAQPSHDWAARSPKTDFSINALGTLNVLDATLRFAPNAPFIFTSTNKVYGDRPNYLPIVELETRWEIQEDHTYAPGIREDMSIDDCTHSLFGASKVAADVLVQEYGRYFGLKTCCFRGGCLTGPNHSGAQLHGFLAYLMKCTAVGAQYTVFGYKGKQVRDNIHSADLIRAFEEFRKAPRCGEVYNIGGGRISNCSMVEAIELCENICSRKLKYTYSDKSRVGDHIWWISDVGKFRSHYNKWEQKYSVYDILKEMYEENVDRWKSM